MRSIYVHAMSGKIMELPLGSTPVDFAYKLSDEIGNTTCAALVNHVSVPLFYPLRDKDVVKIVTDASAQPKEEWLNFIITARPKQKIKEYYNR